MTGRRIAELRARQGLSQAKLARVAGISRQTLRAIEGGTVRRPHDYTLARIASALEVTVAELLGEEEAA